MENAPKVIKAQFLSPTTNPSTRRRFRCCRSGVVFAGCGHQAGGMPTAQATTPTAPPTLLAALGWTPAPLCAGREGYLLSMVTFLGVVSKAVGVCPIRCNVRTTVAVLSPQVSPLWGAATPAGMHRHGHARPAPTMVVGMCGTAACMAGLAKDIHAGKKKHAQFSE